MRNSYDGKSSGDMRVDNAEWINPHHVSAAAAQVGGPEFRMLFYLLNSVIQFVQKQLCGFRALGCIPFIGGPRLGDGLRMKFKRQWAVSGHR